MRKVVRKKIRRSEDGLNVVGDINAVVVSGTGRQGEDIGASVRQRVRIVQRNRRSDSAPTTTTTTTKRRA